MAAKNQAKKVRRHTRRGKAGRFVSAPKKGETRSEMVDYNTITPATEPPRNVVANHGYTPTLPISLAQDITPSVFPDWSKPARKPWYQRFWLWLMGEAA